MVAARGRNGLVAYAVDVCKLGEGCDDSMVVSTEMSMTVLLLMET